MGEETVLLKVKARREESIECNAWKQNGSEIRVWVSPGSLVPGAA
jgi:hypothetical protein